MINTDAGSDRFHGTVLQRTSRSSRGGRRPTFSELITHCTCTYDGECPRPPEEERPHPPYTAMCTPRIPARLQKLTPTPSKLPSETDGPTTASAGSHSVDSSDHPKPSHTHPENTRQHQLLKSAGAWRPCRASGRTARCRARGAPSSPRAGSRSTRSVPGRTGTCTARCPRRAHGRTG